MSDTQRFGFLLSDEDSRLLYKVAELTGENPYTIVTESIRTLHQTCVKMAKTEEEQWSPKHS